MIKTQLSFINGNDEAVLVERVTGLIGCGSPFEAFALEQPHLIISQADVEVRPVSEFKATVEQRIPRELAPLLVQKLDTCLPFSFTLTDLTLWLRLASGGEPFAAKIWPAISCEKKQYHIVCEKI